jgi:hypothetical protein
VSFVLYNNASSYYMHTLDHVSCPVVQDTIETQLREIEHSTALYGKEYYGYGELTEVREIVEKKMLCTECKLERDNRERVRRFREAAALPSGRVRRKRFPKGRPREK